MVQRRKSYVMLVVLLILSLLAFGCSSNNAPSSGSASSGSASSGSQAQSGSGGSSGGSQDKQDEVWPEPGRTFYLSTNYGPGGTLQISQEDFKPFFEEELGIRVEIEYIEGAAGLIGYNTVFARPADGYSIVPSSSTFGPYTYPHLSEEKPPWNYEDWLPLGIYSDIPNSGVVVRADSPFQDFTELIMYARDNPGKLNIGTIGPGRIEDIQIIELQHVMGIRVNQVYYDSGGTLFTDLLTGDLDAIVTASLQYAENPDARILTLLATEMPDDYPYPHLNTLVDWTDALGYSLDDIKTLGATHFNGFFVKAGLPDAAYQKLVTALKNIVENPEWQEKVKDYRYPRYRSPEEAKEIYDRYYEGIGEMIKLRDQYQ